MHKTVKHLQEVILKLNLVLLKQLSDQVSLLSSEATQLLQMIDKVRKAFTFTVSNVLLGILFIIVKCRLSLIFILMTIYILHDSLILNGHMRRCARHSSVDVSSMHVIMMTCQMVILCSNVVSLGFSIISFSRCVLLELLKGGLWHLLAHWSLNIAKTWQSVNL